MKNIILLLILFSIGFGIYKIISNTILKIINIYKKYKKDKLYKAEIRNQYYERLNTNQKYNYRKGFGLEEEKGWKEYWNNNQSHNQPRPNYFFKIILFIFKLIWRIVKIIAYLFILLILLSIYEKIK